jgi:hypothetical protein
MELVADFPYLHCSINEGSISGDPPRLGMPSDVELFFGFNLVDYH